MFLLSADITILHILKPALLSHVQALDLWRKEHSSKNLRSWKEVEEIARNSHAWLLSFNHIVLHSLYFILQMIHFEQKVRIFAASFSNSCSKNVHTDSGPTLITQRKTLSTMETRRHNLNHLQCAFQSARVTPLITPSVSWYSGTSSRASFSLSLTSQWSPDRRVSGHTVSLITAMLISHKFCFFPPPAIQVWRY